ASMEPRRIHRGNIVIARADYADGTRLQWSRGEFTAETSGGAGGESRRGVASTEPRRIHRGNLSRRVRLGGLVRASMEPRRIHRGNGDTGTSGSSSGGRFNGAAANSPRKPPPTATHLCTLRGFNGAAANSPRKQGAT